MNSKVEEASAIFMCMQDKSKVEKIPQENRHRARCKNEAR